MREVSYLHLIKVALSIGLGVPSPRGRTVLGRVYGRRGVRVWLSAVYHRNFQLVLSSIQDLLFLLLEV